MPTSDSESASETVLRLTDLADETLQQIARYLVEENKVAEVLSSEDDGKLQLYPNYIIPFMSSCRRIRDCVQPTQLAWSAIVKEGVETDWLACVPIRFLPVITHVDIHYQFRSGKECLGLRVHSILQHIPGVKTVRIRTRWTSNTSVPGGSEPPAWLDCQCPSPSGGSIIFPELELLVLDEKAVLCIESFRKWIFPTSPKLKAFHFWALKGILDLTSLEGILLHNELHTQKADDITKRLTCLHALWSYGRHATLDGATVMRNLARNCPNLTQLRFCETRLPTMVFSEWGLTLKVLERPRYELKAILDDMRGFKKLQHLDWCNQLRFVFDASDEHDLPAEISLEFFILRHNGLVLDIPESEKVRQWTYERTREGVRLVAAMLKEHCPTLQSGGMRVMPTYYSCDENYGPGDTWWEWKVDEAVKPDDEDLEDLSVEDLAEHIIAWPTLAKPWEYTGERQDIGWRES